MTPTVSTKNTYDYCEHEFVMGFCTKCDVGRESIQKVPSVANTVPADCDAFEARASMHFWNGFRPKDCEKADRHSFVEGAKWAHALRDDEVKRLEKRNSQMSEAIKQLREALKDLRQAWTDQVDVFPAVLVQLHDALNKADAALKVDGR